MVSCQADAGGGAGLGKGVSMPRKIGSIVLDVFVTDAAWKRWGDGKLNVLSDAMSDIADDLAVVTKDKLVDECDVNEADIEVNAHF